MTQDPRQSAAAPAEKLGEPPAAYHDDRVVLLARDPRTLFVYWDFAPATVAAAFHGLPGACAVLRLYEGARVMREVDIALEAGTWYVQAVEPDREWRVEIFAVGANGESRRIGRPAHLAFPPPPALPPPDRFRALPWERPLTGAEKGPAHEAEPGLPAPEVAAALSPLPPPDSDFPGRAWRDLPMSGSGAGPKGGP